MSYGVFESLETSESEHRVAANAALKDLDRVIVEVRARHGSYLNAAVDQKDFYDRLQNVKTSMRKVVEGHGIHPRQGVMNKVYSACKNDARPHWRKRQAAAGTSVDDAAPPTDLAAPVGTLQDNPVGAVASRRTAAAEDAPGYETQYGMPAGEVTNTAAEQLASRRVGGGFRDFLQQGLRGLSEGMVPGEDQPGLKDDFFRGLDHGIESELPPEHNRPPQVRESPHVQKNPDHSPFQEFVEGMGQGIHSGSVSDRQYLSALMTADFDDEHRSLSNALIPEGDFDAYLNRVTGPETDAASEHPFGSRDGEHDWENTGKTSRFQAALKESVGIGPGIPGQGLPQVFKPHTYTPQRLPGVAKPHAPVPGAPGDFNFTGSPETQYHHKQKPWPSEGDFDQDAMYDRQRAAAVHYHGWCTKNELKTGSVNNLGYFGARVPISEYADLLGAIREAHAQRAYRTAAGKDHLQTSQDAITKMLNELAEDFQKSIVPLQDALQSVTFAQQSMQAQSPMNVMPPGSVNVMPEGMQDPNAMGGAPPMQGQSMPAQPGPGGLSPMVDPAATGGAPAGGGAPGVGGGMPGDPMAGLPPEVLQALMGAGGGGGQPAQRPVAAKKDKWYEADDDDDDETDKDDGFGGKKAPPFGSKDSRRRHAEFPFGGGSDKPKDDDSDKDDKPKDDDPPKPKSDGPPSDSGDKAPSHEGPPPSSDGPPEGGDGDDTHAVVEAIIHLLDAGDIEAAQKLADQFQITDDDVNSFAPSDPYDTGDPYGAAPTGPPAPAGPPPGPPPSPDAGPPPGLPPGGPPPDMPPEVKAAAVNYLRWADRYELPINRQTVEMFHEAAAEYDDRGGYGDGYDGYSRGGGRPSGNGPHRFPGDPVPGGGHYDDEGFHPPPRARAGSRRPLVAARR